MRASWAGCAAEAGLDLRGLGVRWRLGERLKFGTRLDLDVRLEFESRRLGCGSRGECAASSKMWISEDGSLDCLDGTATAGTGRPLTAFASRV